MYSKGNVIKQKRDGKNDWTANPGSTASHIVSVQNGGSPSHSRGVHRRRRPRLEARLGERPEPKRLRVVRSHSLVSKSPHRLLRHLRPATGAAAARAPAAVAARSAIGHRGRDACRHRQPARSETRRDECRHRQPARRARLPSRELRQWRDPVPAPPDYPVRAPAPPHPPACVHSPPLGNCYVAGPP